MKCKDCKYHSEVNGDYFCDSKIHKRRILRIDKKDAERDINCYWAWEEKENVKNEKRI